MSAPLVQTLLHAMRQREKRWDAKGRWMMNRAVDSLMKDCQSMGLLEEARQAIADAAATERLLKDVKEA